jgi:signal transduction histidine kinase
VIVSLDPGRFEAAPAGPLLWAVPLWSERGLIGVLLLGEKADGGLYTQEEIEIARASGERLIDTQASAEMARRLLALQRERLAETQLLDRRAHRVLHDDILPDLHTALLRLDGASPEAVRLLADVHKRIAGLLHAGATPDRWEVARMGLVPTLRAAVETEFEGVFEAVTWEIVPEAEAAAGRLPTLAAEVLFYATREAVRNAGRYGRRTQTAPLHLSLSLKLQDGLCLFVEDDGAGIEPGRKVSEPTHGGGHGLALHRAMLAIVGGTLSVESEPGRYTRVALCLPLASP